MFLWDIIKDKNLRFLVPKSVRLADCRSAGPVDRSSERSTGPVDQRAQNVHAALLGRAVDLVGRPQVDRQRTLLSGNASVWPGGRPDRELCSLYPAWSTGQSTAGLNGQIFDRWPVDRKGILALFSCQRADSKWGYKYPHLRWFLTRIFKSKIFIFSSVLIQVFKRVFGFKRSIFICF